MVFQVVSDKPRLASQPFWRSWKVQTSPMPWPSSMISFPIFLAMLLWYHKIPLKTIHWQKSLEKSSNPQTVWPMLHRLLIKLFWFLCIWRQFKRLTVHNEKLPTISVCTVHILCLIWYTLMFNYLCRAHIDFQCCFYISGTIRYFTV